MSEAVLLDDGANEHERRSFELINGENEQAVKQSSDILSRVIGNGTIVAEGISPAEIKEFFKAEVFPAVTKIRTRHTSALPARYSEIIRYIDGESYDEIGKDSELKPASVKANIFKTVDSLFTSNKGYAPDDFKQRLESLHPGIEFKEREISHRRAKRIGQRAIAKDVTPKVEDTPDGPMDTATILGILKAATKQQKADREIEGRDSVGLYLDEIGQTGLLNAAMEVELSRTIEAGLLAQNLLDEGRIGRAKGGAPKRATKEELEWLAEEGKQARQIFLESNLRLVVSIARKYGRAQMPQLDLIQEGNTGLIRAVEKFDFAKGYKFSTYATWWVRQAITRGIAQQARVVRLPVHVVEELNEMGGARRTLERDLGREPTPQEVAQELDKDIDRVLDLMAWGREHISLDTPVDEDGDTTLGDLMVVETAPSPDLTFLDNEARERLESLVRQLDERAADIIRARYGLIDGRQQKLADIGSRHGISAERVRQLEREALQKLRRLGDPDLAD
jgi:RNA polymerase primary sigma factor